MKLDNIKRVTAKTLVAMAKHLDPNVREIGKGEKRIYTAEEMAQKIKASRQYLKK